MKEVAEAAGVSTATVSRVLGSAGYASSSTRARVTEAATRLGYQLDAVAQGLRRRRSTSIGVLVPDLSNPVALSFLRGVQHVAMECGYAVVVADAQRRPDVERRQLQLFRSQRVAAILVSGPLQDPAALDELDEDGSLVRAPYATGDTSGLEDGAIDAAMADLAGHGHRHVLFVARSVAAPSAAAPAVTENRRRVVISTAARHGLRATNCSLPRPLTADQRQARLHRHLSAPDGPRAVLCASHTLAPQLLVMLGGLGYGIPDDLSFITFGDSEWARAFRPPLAVIDLDRYDEARWLTHDVLRDLGAQPTPVSRPEGPTYVTRPSVSQPPT
jgi:DNA-binding LacI/PurR family transcriptional regulator